MEDQGSYWAAMAQVMPVMAVAVVLEIRQISIQWDERTPSWVKVVQSLTWAVLLVVLAFGTGTALRALRGVEVADWWSTACEYAVSAGFGVLVLSPALEFLVRGNAEYLAKAITWHPFMRTHRWFLIRQTLRYIKLTGQGLGHRQLLLYGMSAQLSDTEKNLRQVRDHFGSLDKSSLDAASPEIKEYIRSLPDISKDLAASRAGLWDLICELSSDIKEYRLRRAEYLASGEERNAAWRKYSAAEREELASFFQTFSTVPTPSTADLAANRRAETVTAEVEGGPGGSAGPRPVEAT